MVWFVEFSRSQLNPFVQVDIIGWVIKSAADFTLNLQRLYELKLNFNTEMLIIYWLQAQFIW